MRIGRHLWRNAFTFETAVELLGFRKKVRDIFHRQLFDEAIGIDRHFGLLPDQVLLDFLHFLGKFFDSLDFRGAKAQFGKGAAEFPVLQAAEDRKEHRDG